MTDSLRGFVALAGQIDGDNRQWIEVMPAADKARNGPWYFTITADDLEAYADYIRQNPDRIVVDYDHEGADGGSTVAAGWFTGQAEVRDTDQGPRLYAQVEWTPQGADDVRNKRFRFISPEWSMRDKDPKTGLLTRAKELLAATLTNRPFFRQLAPVARDLLDSADLEQAVAELGDDVVEVALHALAVTGAAREAADRILAAVWTAAYINDLPDSCFLYIEPGGNKDSEGKTTPRSLRHFPVRDASGKVDMPHLRNAMSRIPQSNLPADVKERCTRRAQQMMRTMGGQAATKGDQVDTTLLAKSLGLAEDADETAIADAIKARDQENADLKAKLADLEQAATETDTLRAEVAAIKAERELDRKKQLVAQAIRDRQALPVQTDVLLALSVDQLAEYVEKTPKASFQPAGDGGTNDDDDAKVDDAVRARFASDAASLDDESLELHVKAEKYLTDHGKPAGVYTGDDYAAALAAVS